MLAAALSTTGELAALKALECGKTRLVNCDRTYISQGNEQQTERDFLQLATIKES